MSLDGIAPFFAYIEGLAPPGYFANIDNQTLILNMITSEVPTSSQNNVWFDTTPSGTSPCKVYVTVTYSGNQAIPPKGPGTVIEEPPLPPPVMPPPVEPPVIQQCRQRIQEKIQQPVDETGYVYDRLKAQATGQIDYQLQQVEPALAKISQKIDSNIVNTMGEVYSAAYPIGLGIPTTDEIMEGTPVYSPYGIGATVTMVAAPYVPYCDELPPTPTSTPSPPPAVTGYPPPTTPPGVTCPAPVVQCPAPPDITFSPVINVTIPSYDAPDVTVTIEPPPITPAPEPPYPPYEPEEEEEDEEEPVVDVDVEEEAPTPSPTPSPTPTPDSCPVLPPPEKPKPPPGLDLGDVTPRGSYGNWATANNCGQTNSGSVDIVGEIFGAFGWTSLGGNVRKPPDYLNPEKYSAVFAGAVSLAMNAVGVIIDTTAKAAIAAGPVSNNWQDFLVLSFGGVVERWVGAPITQFMQTSVYNINYQDPQRIPSEAEVVSLYLSGEINEQTMRCLVRANGSYDTWYDLIANANRTKLTNDQIIQLYRREIIPGDFADKLMRGNGVINQNEANMIYRASEAMPSVSDIVRFMVRDADDDTVAGKYGTDAALDSKYGRQLKLWAKGQGITDEVMKYYWRSHWEIPSNTALFEMLHRLRPNKTGQGLTGGVTVSPSDIKDALVVNDVLPYWADRLIEISYKPLTRTDAQRAYFIDALSENELTDAYLDLGYNDSNAAKLVRFTNQLKAKRKQSTGGTEKASSILKYYKNWLIGDTEARQRLKNSGLSETAAVEALQIAGNQRKNDSQLACIRGVKSKYKRFIYGDSEARQDLIAIGVALENIDNLVSQWNCERGNKPKELSAAQVCKAYKQELIDEMEYLRRLQAIGYGIDEAGIMFELCTRPPAPKTTKTGNPITPKTQIEKDSQTAAARAVTQAALDALATGN
jgi:hypothetical protein